MARAINPKGISTRGGSNGPLWREKKASLPPSAPSVSRGRGQKAPAAKAERSTKSTRMSVRQAAPSSALKVGANKGWGAARQGR